VLPVSKLAPTQLALGLIYPEMHFSLCGIPPPHTHALADVKSHR